MSKPFSDRLPAWVFWPLYALLLLMTVGSTVGLHLLSTPDSPTDSVIHHEQP